MHYVALGDSISIDTYTGVPGGGAASQLARLLNAEPFQSLTRDGNVTSAVLLDLDRVQGQPKVATLTVGGNNLLVGHDAPEILADIREIIQRLIRLLHGQGGRVVLCTVYDPTDGNDALGESHGLEPELRQRLSALNAGIRRIAAEYGCLLADLEVLFKGHGIVSANSWIVMSIEPNLAGATAIARHWHELVTS